MKRFYQQIFSEHFRKNRQMLFAMGPRQVGKTTIGLNLQSEWDGYYYYNWDSEEDRELILKGGRELARELNLGSPGSPAPLIVFDEIHKYPKWKTFLKGFYDVFPFLAHVMVTGSARLDVYQKGGDSLMGRYFRYRVHPLSVRELVEPEVVPLAVRPDPCKISDDQFQALWRFGGFPDPLLRGEEEYHSQWSLLRYQQLFRDDIRDLSIVREIQQLETLAELIRRQVGGQVSKASLARKVKISNSTCANWLQLLSSLYYCFEVRPWTRNVTRSLIKEPKLYMVDWSVVPDLAARAENMVASHLLKAVHFWTDSGMGNFGLHYLRDKEKREVDFVVSRNDQPWMLVEVKLGDGHTLSPSLAYFQKQLQATYAFQVVLDMPATVQTCFLGPEPKIVPARTFLSQLV